MIPWPEIERHFQVARTQIQKGEIDWRYVEGVGLTSPTVAWKRDIMKEAAKQGVMSRFLKLANSFLGSLSGGLPIVEFIKEFKDFVEACLKLRRVYE